MIPKIIHYCWFGENQLSDKDKECISSWKKYLPDYEIIEWNESNFNVNCNNYVREAYNSKKWAYVSDYARFKILYEYGGIYLDTDVELINSIQDIVDKGNFLACESDNPKLVATGLGFGFEKGNLFLKEILNDYEEDHFLSQQTTNSYTTVVERITKILKNKGLKDTSEIICLDNIYIYPKEFFCPLNYTTQQMNITQNTRSIHWYSGSWIPRNYMNRNKKAIKIRNKIPLCGSFMAFVYMKLTGIIEILKELKNKYF